MFPLTPEKILQTGMGFWASKTLLSAVELGVFTALAAQPGDMESIAQRTGLHARGARDFLDALVALGFLQREGGVYRNAPDADLFLDRNKPTYLGGALEVASRFTFSTWAHLTSALRTGQRQNAAAGGKSKIRELYASTEALKSFLAAMSAVSRMSNMAIAQAFPWGQYQTFVDAGCAQGDLAVQIARSHPHIRGTGFDLAPVQPVFEEYVAQAGLKERLAFQGGDFFADPLPRADVVSFGHILHDWNLEEKKALLRKAYDALPSGGAVLVYDALIDDDRSKNVFGLLMSLNMLVESEGGFDYTGADCTAWLREVGFGDVRTVPLFGPDSMVIGVK